MRPIFVDLLFAVGLNISGHLLDNEAFYAVFVFVFVFIFLMCPFFGQRTAFPQSMLVPSVKGVKAFASKPSRDGLAQVVIGTDWVLHFVDMASKLPRFGGVIQVTRITSKYITAHKKGR